MENLDKVVYEKIARKDLSFGCIIFKKPSRQIEDMRCSPRNSRK